VRNSRHISGAVFAGAALLISGSAGVAAKPVRSTVPQPADEAALRARADALLAQMTPEEKAAQLQTIFVMSVRGAPKPEDRAAGGIGSLAYVSAPAEINRLQRIAMEKSRLKIPILFGYDVVHGLRTIFPVPIATAASWDIALAERSQSIAAAEARAVGIQWTFAPMIDIARDPRWGRMVEGAGEDPYLGSAMAAAQVRGFQGTRIGSPGRVVAGPKHFAGYGAALGGRDYDEANLSDAELWNVYLPPFKAAVDAGAGSIMTSYMALNGIPGAANRWLLTDVLRNQWGFTGWTVSDNQGVKNLTTHGFARDRQDAAQRAFNAGLGMEMAVGTSAYSDLSKVLSIGRIDGKQLDDAVRRVLEAKLRMGLFEQPYVDEAAVDKVLGNPAHRDAARIAAERAAVLLRNEGALLPLDRKKLKSLAIIGPLADSARDALGPWVFPDNKPPMRSILSGLREKVGSGVAITYSPGVAMPSRLNGSPIEMLDRGFTRPAPADDATGIADAVKAASSADVTILVLGEGQNMVGEMASSSSLGLPGRQQELLDAVVATGKPIVVVLMNGRPLDLKDTKAQAILDIWYPGSLGAVATANLLFGDAVPGGKLPFTWPRNASQVPVYYAHLASHDPKNADRRYWNEPNAPAYPFGYGLSYSTFAYSNLHVDRPEITPEDMVSVSVDLKNSGPRTADEVAQLYIHQRSGTAARPVRELKGFQRVTLRPGETRTLTFKLGPAELRYWNAAVRGWVIDESGFDVAVGTDSTAVFSAEFTIKKAA